MKRVLVWYWWPFVASAACDFPSLPRLSVADGAAGVANDGIDEPAQFDFVPMHLDRSQLPAVVRDLTLPSETIIDTSQLTVGGAPSSTFVQQGSYAVLYAGAVTIRAHLTITGSLPLIVAATKSIHVTDNVDLGAIGSTPGPGAVSSGAGSSGAAYRVGALPDYDTGGGGGGSHVTSGAPGGTINAQNAPAGMAGPTYDASSPGAPLMGGSPGGAGAGQEAMTPGGGGGGALQLSAQTGIFIGDIAINAGGGGGRGGTNELPGAAGGGGGAGGEILLEAPILTLEGFLAANGGGGGGGGGDAGGTVGTAGMDGGNGTVSFAAASGGANGAPAGATGGTGATYLADGTGVQPSSGDDAEHGGGGGGGEGIIWLRYQAATPPDLAAVHFSPAPQTDNTLP